MPQTRTTPKKFEINTFELAEIIRNLSGSSTRKIDYILKTAERELKITSRRLNYTLAHLCYSESFLKIVGMPYDNPNTKLIRAGLAHYYLTH